MDSFSLLESAPDAMVIVDADGSIRLVNAQAERLFGYTRQELRGQPVEMLVPSRLREPHREHRDAYARHPTSRSMGSGLELYAVKKDGSEIPVEISLSPIRTERDTLMVVSSIRDITERRQYERALREKNEELVRANAAKNQFLASMSHELRTPLNAIIGFTGVLLMKLPGPLTPDQEKHLNIVQSSARHLLALINDVLDLAKIESGRVGLHVEPIVMADVIDEVADSMRSLAAEKRLDLRVSLPPEPILLNTDRRAVRQILLNLTNNAIKYTDSGSVSIAATVDRANGAAWAVMRVSDTGVGIRNEDVDRLFRAFEPLDSSSTRRVDGIGLGLHLSHKLAFLLGGRLTYAANGDVGSTFTLALPLGNLE